MALVADVDCVRPGTCVESLQDVQHVARRTAPWCVPSALRYPRTVRDRFAFTLHGLIYRLVLGALVLAIVIPAHVSGHQPMWPFALAAILVVIVGILVARRPRMRGWLRRR